MLIIKTADLRTFVKKTAHIKTSKLISACQYFKLTVSGKKAFLTKTNLQSFCEMPLEVESKIEDTLLIDEQVLTTLLKVTSSDIITVSVDKKANTITLQDDQSKVSFQTEDIRGYPATPPCDFNGFCTLTREMIETIFICRAFTAGQEEFQAAFTCVHMVSDSGKTEIWGSDRAICHHKTFETESTSALLNGECLETVSKLEECEFKAEGNFYIVKSDEAVFYFRQPEFKTPDISPFIIKMKEKTPDCLVSLRDMITFCELTNSISGGIPFCSITDNGNNSILLQLVEDQGTTGKTNKNSKDISVSKTEEFEEFTFNSKLMYPVLKAIGYSEISIRQAYDALIIESDEDKNTLTFIKKLSKS